MQAIVVPKSRKPKFDLSFRILDLNNIPYIAGQVYVKWHVSHAEKNEDRTPKSTIKDHKAIFDYAKTTPVKLVIDKNNWLQESIFTLEVIHEVKDGGKGDRSMLGNVRMNLAEYVEVSRLTSDFITRRYLLHESKINSTIKIAIRLVQTDGERNFMAPQLRSAPQFVGIAGVMAGEHVVDDDSGPLPTLDPQIKEAGDELRELYKKTLAAELTCQPGDPSADQVVEDIFSGGDGWGSIGRDGSDTASSRRGGTGADDAGGNWSDGETHALHLHHHHQQQHQQHRGTGLRENKRSWPDLQSSTLRKLQPLTKLSNSGGAHGSRESLHKNEEQFRNGNARRSRGSFGQSSHRNDLNMDKERIRQMTDVDELDVREDLRCWISRPMK